MRVDPNYISNLASTISQSNGVLASLTNELSSGLRVNSLGDDPAAAAASLKLSTTITNDDTFVQTATQEQGLLQVTDSALGEVVTQLTSAISLATEGATGTLDAAQQQAVVTAVERASDADSVAGEYELSGTVCVWREQGLDAAVYARRLGHGDVRG